MFLFKKKKKLKASAFPELPKIPRESGLPEFPSYKVSAEKPEIPPLPPFKRNLEIPKRELATVNIPSRVAAPLRKEITPLTKQISQEKPLYIQMEEYSKILKTLELIKSKINNAESTLLNLERFKEKEDIELGRWKEEVNKIKENLILVEKSLSSSQR